MGRIASSSDASSPSCIFSMLSSAHQTMSSLCPPLCPPLRDLIYDYPQDKSSYDKHRSHLCTPSVSHADLTERLLSNPHTCTTRSECCLYGQHASRRCTFFLQRTSSSYPGRLPPRRKYEPAKPQTMGNNRKHLDYPKLLYGLIAIPKPGVATYFSKTNGVVGCKCKHNCCV